MNAAIREASQDERAPVPPQPSKEPVSWPEGVDPLTQAEANNINGYGGLSVFMRRRGKECTPFQKRQVMRAIKTAEKAG